MKAVQQHTVFVEIIVEQQENRTQIHEFAAVVGLVKKCKQVRNVFDNAVLWFNDQFLFGDKENKRFNVTETNRFNPNETHPVGETNGFVEKGHAEETPTDFDNATQDDPADFNNSTQEPNDSDAEEQAEFENDTNKQFQERWGGCFIPRGFMHAIGADDPFGIGAGATVGVENDTSRTSLSTPALDNIGQVKNLIDLDNGCGGCIFEYQSTFFITDPNDHQWMVDKLVYPLSLTGNLFGEDAGDHCASDDGGVIGISDPRDNHPHHDRCEDNGDDGDDSDDDTNQDNHCKDDSSGECNADFNDPKAGPLLVEPIYTVRIQVDPTSATTNGFQGFADEAPWQYKNGPTRLGQPYPDQADDPNYAPCKNNETWRNNPHPCAIEYNFLLAVDFAAFDNIAPVSASGGQGTDNATVTATVGGEDERKEGFADHGNGSVGQTQNISAQDGNSHGHNPTVANNDPGPRHSHDAINLDLFFYDNAPFFVEDNPYWDNFGAPPLANDQCSDRAAYSDNADTNEERAAQDNAIDVRAPIVCDVDADNGFHLHDGSQTVS